MSYPVLTLPRCPKNLKIAMPKSYAMQMFLGTTDFFFKKLLLRREWDLKEIMKVQDIPC